MITKVLGDMPLPFRSLKPDSDGTGTRFPRLVHLIILFLGFIAVTSLTFAALEPFRSPSESPVASKTPPEKPLHQNFTVEIRKPDGPPLVDLGITDDDGNAMTATCSTCHATREPNTNVRTVDDLKKFHQNLVMDHGTLTCFSCHNSSDYSALKLADGTRVEFTDVMQLCAQCHGPQMKDYENGVHGGMMGHWDLSLGSQKKNNCVDCHHPHAPQFPQMIPTFKPNDRFLEKHPSTTSESKSDLSHE